MSVEILAIRQPSVLTRLRNTGADGTSLERGAGEIQSLLQALDGLELDISETLGSLCQLVFHETDARHATSREELRDIGVGCFEGKVANVASVGGLGGEIKRLPNGISTTLAL